MDDHPGSVIHDTDGAGAMAWVVIMPEGKRAWPETTVRVEGVLRMRRIEAFVGPAGIVPAVVQVQVVVEKVR
jgi:hypothetical protein